MPVPGELMRLWSDYMHEEYGDLDCDFVFVNLWGGHVGRPLTYSNVDRIVERTQQKVGFHFTVASAAAHVRDAGLPRRRGVGGDRRVADASLAVLDAGLYASDC